jgi:hypothetical protein
MTNRLKHNLLSLGIYTISVFLILTPCKLGWASVSISILLGFLFGLLNDIITQLRKLNGEKFPNTEDKSVKKKDELIKS